MTTLDSSPRALEDLVRRLTRLEDRARIQDLVAAYAIAVDDHDLETLLSLFTEDGEFERAGSIARGREEIREFYVAAMDRYSLTLHSPQSDQISVDGDRARGLLTGRAELALDGTLMMAAYRYSDEYARVDGRWLFRRRDLRFMYAVPFERMNAGLCTTERIQWPGTPHRRADFPESLPTWSTYR
ncbi:MULTISPECIES: nuclear transport factor 2 family protein [Rhodococcus]|uniref:nuclear transport factor 2 family protein n=1 Tax=Rhodococcus TaxID=1827 RepID=UPI00143EF415|nr:MULTISPECIES: nuclear transport factor 2 family protein [unclassified Rhodococcus (in: high G+C Gram-positive bacteria)]QIX52571.1 nuclear transport factor 2 family protein [Rhodococcus sp. DMU1]USC15051.1 nuclear transport factor 2 family protein [Rhodococcus sp. 11-3]